MRYLLLCASIILSEAAIPVPISDPYKLTAVSRRTAQSLYHKIRNMNGIPRVEKVRTPIDGNAKNRICHHITNSGLFSDTFGKQEPYTSQTYVKLLEAKPNVFNALFEESIHPIPGRGTTVFSSRILTGNVLGNARDQVSFKENLFACVTLDHKTGEQPFVYYVSDEYNMSESSNVHIAGRFIFTHRPEEDDNIYIVDAIAEEPAYSSPLSWAAIERYYLETSEGNTLATKPSDDPICSLSADERLRACGIVLSSANFEGELQFVPLLKFIDTTKCEKRRISFRNEDIKSELGDRCYEEWMISCRPKVHHSTFQEEYFLSRVHTSASEVFALRWDGGSKIVIENVFGNVRFKI